MVRQGVGLRPPEAGLQVPVPAVAAVHGLTAVYHFLEGFPNVRHGRRMPLHPAVQVINDHLSRFLVGRSIGDVVDSAGGGCGLGVDQLPAVVHDRQAGEAHTRILPRQPLAR